MKMLFLTGALSLTLCAPALAKDASTAEFAAQRENLCLLLSQQLSEVLSSLEAAAADGMNVDQRAAADDSAESVERMTSMIEVGNLAELYNDLGCDYALFIAK